MRRLAILMMALFAGSGQAANRYFIMAGTNWNSTANWATNSGGTGGLGVSVVPGSSDVAIFDANSTNCTLDANIDVLGLLLTNYPGTLSQSTKTMYIRASDFIVAGGTFLGGSNTITQATGSDFVMSTGTVTATSGNWNMSGSWYSTGGNFTNNSGTLAFVKDETLTLQLVNGALNNLTLNNAFVGLIVSGTAVCANVSCVAAQSFSSGRIQVTNNITTTASLALNAGGTIEWIGSGSSTLSASGSSGSLPTVIINGTGTLTMSDTILLRGDSWTHTQGTIAGNGTLSMIRDSSQTLNSAIVPNLLMDNIYGATIFSGDCTVQSNLTITARTSLIGSYIIFVGGNVTISDTAYTVNQPALTLNGSTDQNIDGTAGTGQFPAGTFTINKSAGNAKLISNATLDDSGQDMVWTNGGLNLSSYTLTVPDAVYISSGGTTQTMAITDTTNGWISVADQVVTNATCNGIADVDLLVDLSTATSARNGARCWIIKAAASGLKGKTYNSVTVSPATLWSGVVTYDQPNGDAYITVTYLGGAAAIPEFPQYRNKMAYDNQL